jgi:hypothetical protein
MIRITLMVIAAQACAWGNSGRLFADETMVVVGAGVFDEPRSGAQFEFSLAAATDGSAVGTSGISNLIRVSQLQAGDVAQVDGQVHQFDLFSADGTPLRAALTGTASVKLDRGPRIHGVPMTAMISGENVAMTLDLGRRGLVSIGGPISSGGATIEPFEPVQLVVALGEGTTVESVFQAAAAIDDQGQAIGRLSLQANADNGDQVYVQGLCHGVTVLALKGPGRLQLHLTGLGEVDVVRPDGSSTDTCFGDFRFVANEGPHGPFRLDMPACRDPLAGIEGSDIGSGATVIAAADYPPPPLRLLARLLQELLSDFVWLRPQVPEIRDFLGRTVSDFDFPQLPLPFYTAPYDGE